MMRLKLLASAAVLTVFGLGQGPAHAAPGCFVGIAMYTLSAPYFAAQQKSAVAQAKSLGCQVTTTDGQDDMQKEISDVQDMIAKGINILILNPRDPEGLVPAANAATAAGVKVVAMDNSIDPAAKIVTLVQSSNQKNGELVGAWLAHKMAGKKMKIALLSGQQGSGAGLERREGVFRGLNEAQLAQNARVDWEVVGQGWGGWAQEGGLNAMEDLLTAHPDINVVLGENDSMVLGARNALKAANRLNGVLLVAAADGQKEALKLIQDGEYGATGLNDPALVATTAVNLAYKAWKGELPAGFPKVFDTTPVVITKANVAQYYKPDAVF
ncbi:substrate-binding domain-containing protein [Acidisoma cladoniae]|jgi:ribose transport system substrate-binding protein|uniref:substrate-binding domain-containing protein n=1 Tax=Acidisoma cladoniae TaxID=3040935 RepID=UPI00254A53D8|nr:substrate-binding domain-containing protein [Acidisoma sp. PAMC 29798]